MYCTCRCVEYCRLRCVKTCTVLLLHFVSVNNYKGKCVYGCGCGCVWVSSPVLLHVKSLTFNVKVYSYSAHLCHYNYVVVFECYYIYPCRRGKCSTVYW